jgi:hypothetical protein
MPFDQVENLRAVRVPVHGHAAGGTDGQQGQRDALGPDVLLVGQHLDGEGGSTPRRPPCLAGSIAAGTALGHVRGIDHELVARRLESERQHHLGPGLDTFDRPPQGGLLDASGQRRSRCLVGLGHLGRLDLAALGHLDHHLHAATAVEPIREHLREAAVHITAVLLQRAFDGLRRLLALGGRSRLGLGLDRQRGGREECPDAEPDNALLPCLDVVSHGSFVDRCDEKVS